MTATRCSWALSGRPGWKTLLLGVVLVSFFGLDSAAAAPPPPDHDGAECERRVAERAQRIAQTPQPAAAALGERGRGLADLDPHLWALSTPAVPTPRTEATGARFAAALDGRAPISTAPELVDAAGRVELALREILVAAAGSANQLPASLQLWSVLDTPVPEPTQIDFQNTLRLSLVRGRVALSSQDLERAAETCVGLWGALRASAGTSLVGRMVATAWGRRARVFCLDVANASTEGERRTLGKAAARIRDGWPALSSTLEREMVFAEVAFFAARWPEGVRAGLPPEAIHLRAAAARSTDAANSGWWKALRHSLFDRWAGRSLCIRFEEALAGVDGRLSLANAALRQLGERSMFMRLAAVSEESSSEWVALFRRIRELDAELDLFRAGLAVWRARDSGGDWPPSLEAVGGFTDARTTLPLRLERNGAQVVVVAAGDLELGVQELRATLGPAP